jgi:hypothetical protein
MSSAARKIISLIILLFFGGILLCMALWATFLRTLNPAPLPVPDPLPSNAILYQQDAELGFINADGSGSITIPFHVPSNSFVSSWGTPMLVSGNEVLIVTVANMPGSMGRIFVAYPGAVAVDCGWYGIVRPAVDGYHIYLETPEGQHKYQPEACGTGNLPEKVFSGVVGALSPDEQFAARADRGGYGASTEPEIVIRNLETDEERIIGEGDFPVWSRDGQWLAYTGPDGMYVVQNTPTAEPRRVSVLQILHPEFRRRVYTPDRGNFYYPPMASWSPDGKWIVYHEYHVESKVQFPGQYSIMKVNRDTGETMKLLDGGYSPFWRWPTEQP